MCRTSASSSISSKRYMMWLVPLATVKDTFPSLGQPSPLSPQILHISIFPQIPLSITLIKLEENMLQLLWTDLWEAATTIMPKLLTSFPSQCRDYSCKEYGVDQATIPPNQSLCYVCFYEVSLRKLKGKILANYTQGFAKLFKPISTSEYPIFLTHKVCFARAMNIDISMVS